MRFDRLPNRSLSARYLTLSVGEALSKLCVLAAFAYLARVLGPSDFGLIELALSVTLIFGLMVEGGLGSYGARHIASAPQRTPQLVARIGLLRGLFSLFAYPAILLLSAAYGEPGLGLLAIYGLIVLVVPFFTQWVFQGLGQMHWVATGTVLRNVVFSSSVFLLVRPGSAPRLVAVAEVMGVLALALLNTIVLRRVFKIRLDWRDAGTGALRVFRDAWSMGASELTWAGLWYAPTIVVGAIAAAPDVAWIAGPVRIVLALHTFVWLYFFNLLPGLSRACDEGLDPWRALTHRSLAVSTWAAGFVAVAGTLLAPLVVGAVFGDGFQAAILPLRIVIWMIPVAWLSGHFRYTLIATGNQRREFVGAAAGAATTVAIAIILVPQAGSVGAAIGLVAGGATNAVLTGAAMFRAVGSLSLVAATWRPLTAAAACLAVGIGLAGALEGTPAAALALVAYGALALTSDAEVTRLGQGWWRR